MLSQSKKQSILNIINQKKDLVGLPFENVNNVAEMGHISTNTNYIFADSVSVISQKTLGLRNIVKTKMMKNENNFAMENTMKNIITNTIITNTTTR